MDNGKHHHEQAQNPTMYGLMGNFNNLPPERQHEFDMNQPGKVIAFNRQQPQDDAGACWWNQLPSYVPSAVIKSKKPESKRSRHHDRHSHHHHHHEEEKQITPPSDEILAPNRMSESGDLGDLPPDLRDTLPMINLEQKSPLIWTIGSIVVMAIIYLCSIVQENGFASLITNPLLGPSSSTLILLGAKYGPMILNGEIWRYITAIWLHSGFIQLLLSAFEISVAYRVEKDSGFFRTLIVFIFSGMYGFILSSLIIPSTISAGSNGAYLGLLGIQLVDVFNSWRAYARPWAELTAVIGSIIALIMLGLTPYFDNYLHIGGIVMGILFGLMLLPNFALGGAQAFCRGAIAFMAFPVLSVLFMITAVVFLRGTESGDAWCEWCAYLDCVNLSGWCHSVSDSSTENVYYLN